ncbi:MAG TPA: hypothetical protein DCZ94_19050 [Lentisphaeria bacterium]|nr:MAG: hypothetical protein A2X48_08850 [Lentisphaerae bacterium GWF2_49_21]HBC89043.1 hypothetical protein [Lentisphaeria bacterium]
MKIDHDIRKAIKAAVEKIGSPYQFGLKVGVAHTTVARWLDGRTENIEGGAWENLYPLILPHLSRNSVSLSMIPGFAGEVQEFIDTFSNLNILQRKQVLSTLKEYQEINQTDGSLPGSKGESGFWIIGAGFEIENDGNIEEFIRLLVKYLKVSIVKKEVVVSSELTCRIWALGSGTLDAKAAKQIDAVATLTALELKYSKEMTPEDLKREKTIRKSLLGRTVDKFIPDKILSFEDYARIKERNPRITGRELLKETSKAD